MTQMTVTTPAEISESVRAELLGMLREHWQMVTKRWLDVWRDSPNYERGRQIADLPIQVTISGTSQQVDDFGPNTDEASSITIADTIDIQTQTFGGAIAALTSIVRDCFLPLGTLAGSAADLSQPGTRNYQPAHTWRALSVDVARNFIAPATMFDIIDLAAALRLNVIHLHLTDDQGWRLEIEGLEDLVARSSSSSTLPGGAGYYSVQDYQELQNHAARRGIVLVPEIDLPGHTHAALYAIAELRGPQDSEHPYTGIEVGFSKLHRENPATLPFISHVIERVAATTTGAWIHIGGDECLVMSDDEYRDLVGAAMNEVAARGKTVAAWQEVAKIQPPRDTWVTVWDLRQGLPRGVREHADNGGLVIAAPAPMAYLDAKYNPTDQIGQQWAGYATLETAYDWKIAELMADSDGPIPVAGVEATIWTETIVGRSDLMRMLLPRLVAIAEIAWWGDAKPRTADFLAAMAKSTWAATCE